MRGQPRSYVRPKEVGFPYVLVALALIVGATAVPGFLSLGHLSSLSMTAAYIGIIAIGQTLVLLLGGIDLSVPYMINLAAVLLTGFQFLNLSSASGIALVLLITAGAGLLNGLGVALFDISPLVMTLGMNSILEGVALIYTSGNPKGNSPGFVTTLSTGGTGIPYVVILWIALAVIVTIVLVFTRFGRDIYSIGSNRTASVLSGLPVKRTIVLAYVVSGLSAGLGGILLTGYSGQSYFGMGDNYLLPSIAIVVIGGTSISGGKGSYVQTVAGALLITIIQAGLVTVNVTQAGQDMLYGAVILLMAYLNRVFVTRDRGRLKLWSGGLSGWLEPVGQVRESVIIAPKPTDEPTQTASH